MAGPYQPANGLKDAPKPPHERRNLNKHTQQTEWPLEGVKRLGGDGQARHGGSVGPTTRTMESGALIRLHGPGTRARAATCASAMAGVQGARLASTRAVIAASLGRGQASARFHRFGRVIAMGGRSRGVRLGGWGV